MAKEMVISANPHETRVAILEDGQLCEIYVEREKEFALVGSIYKGRVTRVLPGMQSSFVEIGLDSDAFLYVSDFLQDIEEYDHVAHPSEDRGQRASGSSAPAATSEGSAGVPETMEPGAAVTPLPGETIGSPSSGAFTGHSSSGTAPGREGFHGRPAYREGRSRDDRGGRGGRDRGRGGRGRSGRPDGRGRGGSRYGRELPPSKYASHRPYEPAEETSGPAVPFEPVLLPGETLSVLSEPHATAAPSATTLEPTMLESEPEPGNSFAEPSAASESAASEAAQPEETAAEPQVNSSDNLAAEPGAPSYPQRDSSEWQRPRFSRGRDRRPGRRDDRRGGHGHDRGHDRRPDYRSQRDDAPQAGWATALEPLPGESLAKAKSPEAPSESASQQPPSYAAATESEPRAGFAPEIEEVGASDSRREEFHHEAHGEEAEESSTQEFSAAPHFADAAETHATPDLTEEEANALAEQVAEAQQEEAERDAEEARAAEARRLEEAGENGDRNGEEENAASETEAEADDQIGNRLPAQESEPGFAAHDFHEGAEEQEEEHEIAGGVTEAEAEAAAASFEAGEPGNASQADAIAAEALGDAQPTQARVRGDFRARMQRPARRGGRRDDRGRDRGRRPFRGHGGHHIGQPKRTQLISDLLKPGQEIIVQIAKEPLGKKGARITSHVALPGRFLVYMPTLDHTGVSRKIASAEERSRLRHLVTEAKGSAGGGFIVRTAASAASPDEVRADVQFLTKTWAEIKSQAEQRKAPALLHRDLNLVERILRDYLSSDYAAIWVDSEEEYTKVLEFVSRFQPQLASRVKLYTKSTPVYEEFGIQQEIDKGLRPKVWLKSGGYIVINHTEALVAIDVNTGKFVGRGSNRLEDTIVRTNLEAAKEIVRQIRLRDLGGIIILDFIDMEERRNREKVMAALDEALKADRAPSKVLRFNEFGLVAITRKRTKQALERTLCQPCPYCTGSGMVKSIPTLCYEIQSEARKMAADIEGASLSLRVHPEIAKALKTRESSLIDELEQLTSKSVIIQADPTLHWEQYDIY